MKTLNHIVVAALLLGFLGIPEARSQSRQRIIVEPTTTLVDGTSYPYNTLLPGDTLFFRGGNRPYLLIRNFKGQSKKPIKFMNIYGAVIFNTDWYYGIVLRNCKYVRLSGSGDPNYFYGFIIQRVQNGAGLSVGDLSSDFEVDHVYISNVSIAGVYAKTDPDCSFTATRDKFTQCNTIFHDNYIENTGDEGMYIGSSFYNGKTITCNGKDTLVYPSLLIGVRVYNNIVKHTGWDGIQVASAYNNCKIYNNLVMYDSQDGQEWQMSGILIGGGSNCDCYNNYIYKGKGDGIESLGRGGYRIFNNIIVDAGRSFYSSDPSKMKHGIYVGDVSTEPNSSFHVLFNDIINPKTSGIRFSSVLSKNNLIASNAIINPGGGTNSYIVVTSPSCSVQIKNNYTSMTLNGAGFADTIYNLLPTSPLINAGYYDNKKITFDYSYHPRPFNEAFDIGSDEYNPNYNFRITLESEEELAREDATLEDNSGAIEQQPLVYPNPVRNSLTIQFTLDSTENIVLDFYNMEGNRIYHTERDGLAEGEQSIVVDVAMFPMGICLYTLRAGRQAFSGRFTKIN
jgi:hypothetical protein